MAEENVNGDIKLENEIKTETTAGETEAQTTESKENGQISDLEKSIIRQVEYYFGDNNLPRDKFLQEQVKLDDGWVTFTVLLTFKRLSSMTTSQDIIADAILKSTNGLLELSEDRSKVRRSPSRPLPELNEDRRKELISRTVYAKGFPLDCKLDTVLDFFKTYDVVENVIMRTYLDKPTKKYCFKGSVFATFATKEQAAKFLEIEKVCYQDKQLIKMWQHDYQDMKKEERNGKNKGKAAQEEELQAFRPPKGTVLYLEGLAENTTRENIKEVFGELGSDVAYVDFNKGDKAGWVRLHNEDSGKEVIEKITDGKLKVCETEATVRLLEGEEETKFLDKVVEDMKNYRQKVGQAKRGRFGGKGGGKGGRGGWNNRKRKANNDSGAPPAKH